jgi:ribosomal protein S14
MRLLKKLLIKHLNLQKKSSFSKIKIVRRCVLTYRPKGTSKLYQLGRNQFRDLLQFGLIPGYKKAVW